jgi:membrane-associated phospholipid phosphatase
MAPHHLATLAAGVALSLAAVTARAEPPLASSVQPDRIEEPALVWPGRPLHPVDFLVTGTFMAGAAVEMMLPSGEDAKRSGGILFDDGVRDALMLHDPDDRLGADTFSDIGLVALSVYPIVVDSALTALAYRRSPEVAGTMAVIDIQALSFTSLVSGGVKRIIDRERPIATACREDPEHDPTCGSSGRHLSFLSGHTSISFTAAGLICLHHSQLGLLGFSGDVLSCVTSMTVATGVGVTRIAADKHYMTDVLAGAGLGLFSGYLMPYLVYYLPGRAPATLRVGGGMITPAFGSSYIGAAYMGAL